MRILFIGHNGYDYPHTRVRCYHFAKALSTFPDVETGVLSFRDDLAPHLAEADIYSASDRRKLTLTGKALARLLSYRDTILYIQKAHFHAAAPFLLHRLGVCPNYIFDYDDYDIPLSNFFSRGIWNRLFFGTNQWDEITYRLAGRARGCVCASHELVNVLQPHNQNLAYIPTGVDQNAFTPRDATIKNDKVVFLWNGLIWGKPILDNLLLLFRAFDYAHNEMAPYQLRIIGGGDCWSDAQAIVAERFSRLPIEWIAWAKPQEMPDHLRNADVGLLPAAGDDLWLKCKSPTKLFEYMASGLPVVASAVGEASHVIEHLESGYCAKDERDFSQGLIRMSNDEQVRRSFGERARTTIEDNYSLPVLGENLYLFLKNIFIDR
ncbi:MAG: glycosyltransferase [Candidatus Hinthialibacter antarcticus]|nr:glycosyltransferase [Candidatus Hinthialibacter antarcticus]